MPQIYHHLALMIVILKVGPSGSLTACKQHCKFRGSLTKRMEQVEEFIKGACSVALVQSTSVIIVGSAESFA